MADFSFPNERLVQCVLRPVYSVASSAIGNGAKLNVTENLSPYWIAEIATPQYPNNGTDLGLWVAFLANLRGGLNRFLASDTSKPTPLSYPSATAPGDIGSGWDGTATVTALGASGALGLSGLPSSFAFLPGDLIGLEQSGKYHLHQVVAAATASAGAVTVSVSPLLDTGSFTTSATARVWKPKAAFIVDPDSIAPSQTILHTSYAFRGRQRI